jgi:4-hydroxy-tetrahydrodipicolinate reductase
MVIRLGIAGIGGRMGREIARLALRNRAFDLVGGIGRTDRQGQIDGREVSIVADPSALLSRIDVLIDFTSPEGAAAHAAACAANGVALVTGTTGLDAAQDAGLRAAAARIPVFHAANMSPGVNAMLALLPGLVRALPGYDVEIVETHHRHKADAPSGTALALARAIAAEGGPLEARASYGRRGLRPRAAGEIGIHAVRGGGNPGEHTVVIAGDGEELRIAHRAFSRASYAQGALRAARLIAGQPPGWYEPATLPGFL